jgi:hypothetical protein
MPLRMISVMMVLAGLSMNVTVAGQASLPPCLMRTDHLQMRLPRHGFTWLAGEETSGRCDYVPPKRWIRNSSGSLNLFVHADGPSGSGHYWNVTIGVARSPRSQPVRGVCLTTSTVGWRTLQQYKKAPLAWLDDIDKDGKAEIILWSSFPLREDASLAEYGQMAWVYRLGSENSLPIDWSLSRRMAREIAGAYRSAPDSTTYHRPLRIDAAEALERFADERCAYRRTMLANNRLQRTGFSVPLSSNFPRKVKWAVGIWPTEAWVATEIASLHHRVVLANNTRGSEALDGGTSSR